MLRAFVLLLTVCEVITIVVSLKLLGLGLTLLLAVLAFGVGLALLRHQGLRTADRIVTRLEFGEPPMDEAWDGICLMIAAFLFMLPGLFSDLIALLLLLPPLRHALRAALFSERATRGNYWFDAKVLRRPTVIEAEWHEVSNS